MIGFSYFDGKRQPVERNGFPALEQPRQHWLFGCGGSVRLGSRAIVDPTNTEAQT
jgi:hypothetical protein